MKRSVTGFVVSAACFSLAAGTMTWTNVTDSTGYWTNLVNWTDADGIHPAEPPTNGTHEIVFADTGINDFMHSVRWTGYQRWVNNSWNGVESGLSISSITDLTPNGRRQIHFKNPTASYGLVEPPVTVTIDDPSGFNGIWRSDWGRLGYVFTTAADKPVEMSDVALSRRPYFDVQNEGAKVTVRSVFERGTLEKRGAGELHVMATPGASTAIHVGEGTLTLEGTATENADGEIPVSGAWMHLDATRTDTMKTYTGDDGRTYVTNWADVRGNGEYVYFDDDWKRAEDGNHDHLTANSSAPFLNPSYINGVTVMDFGRNRSSQDESIGPVGCWMRFRASKSGIREVFYTASYLSQNTSGCVLGDFSAFPFHRGGNGRFVTVSSAIQASGTDMYACVHPVRFGDIIINGAISGNSGRTPENFNAVGVGTTKGITLSLLATDRLYGDSGSGAARTGGCRIGEIILFTNVLSHAERVQISNYLMRKWKLGDAVSETADAQQVTLDTSSSVLSVPEGRTAKVMHVSAADGTFVKGGEGVLAVGSVSALLGKPATVNVQGGEVVFDGIGETETDAPAQSPYFWLDATASSSFVYTNKTDDTSLYLLEWHDRRPEQTEVFAKHPVVPPTNSSALRDYKEGNFPKVIENAVGGKAVVDFGTRGIPSSDNSVTASFMQLNTGSSTAYEAFIAFRFTDSKSLGQNVFGTTNIRLYRSHSEQLLSPGYGDYRAKGAQWTVNGVPVDPVKSGQGVFKEDEIYIVSVSASTLLPIDLVGGKDRFGQGTSFGGYQLAEQILYNRVLTPSERRQTIAYLMKRWRGEDACFTGPTRLAAMQFAADDPVVFNSGTELEVSSVEGGNGTVVKKGSGPIKVSVGDVGVAENFTVSEGVLEVSYDFIADSAFHFDVSDTDSISYYVTDDGETTNITSIADVRRNGLTADVWINDPKLDNNNVNWAVAYTNPVLRAFTMADGKTRPAIDFGRKSGYYSNKYPDSSGLKMSTRFTNIREAHSICADHGNHNGTFFGDSGHYHFMRGTGLFSQSYASVEVTNGYIAVDGVEAHPYSAFPSGFHLVSVSTLGNTSISTLGLERNIEAGGICISEQIGFTNVLSSVQRRYLQDYLMHKWMGAPKPFWPETVDFIDVAAGATFRVTDGVQLNVGRISGAGTIDASVSGVAEIEIKCENGTTVPLAISGDIAFADSVTVKLTGDVDSLTKGDYPLVTGIGEIQNVKSWTIDGVIEHHTKSVKSYDGTLWLRLLSDATIIILR